MNVFHKNALCVLLLLTSSKYAISESPIENPSLLTCLSNKVASSFRLYKEQLQARARLNQRNQELVSLKDRNLLSDAKYLYKQICYLSPEDKFSLLAGSTAIIITAYMIYCLYCTEKKLLEEMDEENKQARIRLDNQRIISEQYRAQRKAREAKMDEAKIKHEQFMLEQRKLRQDQDAEASNNPQN